MNKQLDRYKKSGALALRHMWFVVVFFSAIQIIVSISVAARNNTSNGYKSASYTAIWAMFLVVIFAILGGQIVFQGKKTPLLVGFLIGAAAMLSQLFFMLACVYFGLGAEAAHNQWVAADADKAYGAFALINAIIYLVWAIILGVHREEVMMTQEELASTNAAISSLSSTTYNPTHTHERGGGMDYGHPEDNDRYE